MTFSEFVNRLFPIIGAGSSTHAFTRSMFDAVLDDSGQSILDEYSNETYKAYYNGSTGISRIAKKVCAYMEPENFVSYIEDFPDATRDSLCEVFKESISGCDSYNISQSLADLFAEIIRTAAATKRGATARAKKKTDVVPTASDDDQVIVDALSKPLLAFAGALEAQKHQLAEQIRQNNKKSDSSEDESDNTEAEVVDGEEPSGAATGDKTVVHQTIVNQYGDHPVHIDHVENLKL